LTCLLSRRRIGAYLDGALEPPVAGRTAAHLEACERCHREAEGLRRLRRLLSVALTPPAEPDWTGFWQGVARGVEERRQVRLAPVRARWTSRRLAVGGALAAAVAISVAIWQLAPGPVAFQAPVVLSAANTEYPGGTMVYSPPEQDMAVVWVFDQ
jgi:anti-sigma factor RsiW